MRALPASASSCRVRWLPSLRLPLPATLLATDCHAPVCGHGNRLLAGEIRTGDGAAARADLLGRALGDDLPAVSARAGTEIQQLVGIGDHLAIVLDQQQGVAQVAEFLQGRQQSGLSRGCRPIVGSSST